jgi:hypothetical protein
MSYIRYPLIPLLQLISVDCSLIFFFFCQIVISSLSDEISSVFNSPINHHVDTPHPQAPSQQFFLPLSLDEPIQQSPTKSISQTEQQKQTETQNQTGQQISTERHTPTESRSPAEQAACSMDVIFEAPFSQSRDPVKVSNIEVPTLIPLKLKIDELQLDKSLLDSSTEEEESAVSEEESAVSDSSSLLLPLTNMPIVPLKPIKRLPAIIGQIKVPGAQKKRVTFSTTMEEARLVLSLKRQPTRAIVPMKPEHHSSSSEDEVTAPPPPIFVSRPSSGSASRPSSASSVSRPSSASSASRPSSASSASRALTHTAAVALASTPRGASPEPVIADASTRVLSSETSSFPEHSLLAASDIPVALDASLVVDDFSNCNYSNNV